MSRATVCLVTTGHLATNPRLVKEADALVAAGYTVRVVCTRFLPWADAADAAFVHRSWWPPSTRIPFGALATPARRLRQRIAGRAAQAAFNARPTDALAVRALHPAAGALSRAARRVSADLYIAHNLAALPAAWAAARMHGARLQFDAEDFHRGEAHETPETAARLAVTRRVEAAFVPRAHAVTAASEGIADAYAAALGIARPTVVLNVFPRADRDVPLPDGAEDEEREPGTRTLYWFSQTIGPDRGLDDALAALPSLPDDVHLALRGGWSPDFREAFFARAAALGVASRVRTLVPAPPDEMVARAACHSVGLALEQPDTVNRDLCLTNKAFTYLLAGVPVVATNTTGQAAVAHAIPVAVALVPPGDGAALAAAALRLLGDASARSAARQSAERYNWDVEQERFLAVVHDVLGRTTT